MTPEIEELVKRLRYNRSKFNADDREALEAADALVSLSAQVDTISREKEALEEVNKIAANRAWELYERIATLEAQLKAFRIMSNNNRDNNRGSWVHVRLIDCNIADRVLMSTLQSSEPTDAKD